MIALTLDKSAISLTTY